MVYTQSEGHSRPWRILLVTHEMKPGRRLEIIMDLSFLDVAQRSLLDQTPQSLEITVLRIFLVQIFEKYNLIKDHSPICDFGNKLELDPFALKA